MSKPEGEWHEGACPFCRADLRVNWESKELLHGFPLCEKFRTLSADDFVRAVLAGEHRT